MEATANHFGDTKKLDGFTLKMIAIIAMTIDHIGAVFFPNRLILRVIGRLTMPIMAFLIVEGYYYTSNLKKYIGRLLLVAAISFFPYAFAFDDYSTALNVMTTLALGLMALWCIDHIPNHLYKFLAVIALTFVSYFADWSFYGVLMVVAFGSARKNQQIFNRYIIIIFSFLTLLGLPVFLLTNAEIAEGTGLAPTLFNKIMIVLTQGAACFFALPLLSQYNGKRGINCKWLFYLYYPLHLIVICLIKWWLKI